MQTERVERPPCRSGSLLASPFDEVSKAFVRRTAVEKRAGSLVQACSLARLNVQKDSRCSGVQNTSIVYTMFVCTDSVEGLNDEEHNVEC